MLPLLLAAALACAPAAAFAQAAPPAAPAGPVPAAPLPDADPALWVVRDADTTIYLFGTFHLLDGRPWFNDEVRTAFDASDELVMEAVLPENPASLQPLILRYAIDPEGRTLASRLSPAQNEALARALGQAGVPPTAFDRFEPWFVSMTLAVIGAQRLGISSDAGPETTLTAAAHARRIPIGELEGFELQLRLLDSMPEAMQLAQLAETLEKNDEIAAKLAPMLAAWSSGDVERLAALLNEEEDESDRALHRLLFTERNANWARWIAERMARPGTVFLAVGAGHLAGPDSVQAALAARGLAATRVPHVEAP
ncbi:MAG TPA: TraB/GumN family protein [Allosphingosinicella sp.]|nr:TraB/GumN family protein [Allosphingosinicella sp.]